MARLAEELGIAAVKFNDLITLGRGHDNRENSTSRLDERREVAGRLREIKRKPTLRSRARSLRSTRSLTRSARHARHPRRGNCAAVNYLSGCGALRDECAIRPDGYATPCDRLTDLVAGSILDTGLDVIWSKSAVFREFSRRFTTPITDLATCTDCRYAPYCTAGCAAAAYAASGTTLARDPSCCLRLAEEEASRESR